MWKNQTTFVAPVNSSLCADTLSLSDSASSVAPVAPDGRSIAIICLKDMEWRFTFRIYSGTEMKIIILGYIFFFHVLSWDLVVMSYLSVAKSTDGCLCVVYWSISVPKWLVVWLVGLYINWMIMSASRRLLHRAGCLGVQVKYWLYIQNIISRYQAL